MTLEICRGLVWSYRNKNSLTKHQINFSAEESQRTSIKKPIWCCRLFLNVQLHAKVIGLSNISILRTLQTARHQEVKVIYLIKLVSLFISNSAWKPISVPTLFGGKVVTLTEHHWQNIISPGGCEGVPPNCIRVTEANHIMAHGNLGYLITRWTHIYFNYSWTWPPGLYHFID